MADQYSLNNPPGTNMAHWKNVPVIWQGDGFYVLWDGFYRKTNFHKWNPPAPYITSDELNFYPRKEA